MSDEPKPDITDADRECAKYVCFGGLPNELDSLIEVAASRIAAHRERAVKEVANTSGAALMACREYLCQRTQTRNVRGLIIHVNAALRMIQQARRESIS